jgi:ATP-dependent RNA circularization protein (DNA/RNA ligase family)
MGWWYWFLELLGFSPNGNVGGLNQRGPKEDRKIYDVERFKNYPNVLHEGEQVIVTEKIHGSNARYTYEDGVMYVGSRTMWKSPGAKCIWRDALEQNPDIETWCRAHPSYTLYGEVVPTQGDNFRYGAAPGKARFFLFDILNPFGEWISKMTTININNFWNVETTDVSSQK